MAKQSKRMKALAAKVPGTTPLPLDQAVAVLKTFNTTKFDQTVEIAVRLGVDPKQADQLVRGSIVLPHGIGKSLRVIVFAKGDKVGEAEQAGANEVGGAEMADKIKGGWTDFDVCIAAPDMMGVVGPLGKVLGPSRPDPEKLSPYECGFEAFEDARMKFDVRYYLVAILFILFDLEIAFVFPWAVSLDAIGFFGFMSMMVFLAILVVGFVYEWMKGALDWE